MSTHIPWINLQMTGLVTHAGDNFYNMRGAGLSLPILRVTGEIMLYSEKEKTCMGDFAAKNLINNSAYTSYWIHLPDELWGQLNFIRAKNYDLVSTNSPISFVVIAHTGDTYQTQDLIHYSIEKI